MDRVWTRVSSLARTTASALEGPAARLRRGALYPVLVALAGITFAAMVVQPEESATHEVLFTVCMASVLAFSLLDVLSNRAADAEGSEEKMQR
jgi:ABC-type transport system involved in cytochrome c biogenesis permease subunit